VPELRRVRLCGQNLAAAREKEKINLFGPGRPDPARLATKIRLLLQPGQQIPSRHQIPARARVKVNPGRGLSAVIHDYGNLLPPILKGWSSRSTPQQEKLDRQLFDIQRLASMGCVQLLSKELGGRR